MAGGAAAGRELPHGGAVGVLVRVLQRCGGEPQVDLERGGGIVGFPGGGEAFPLPVVQLPARVGNRGRPRLGTVVVGEQGVDAAAWCALFETLRAAGRSASQTPRW